MEFERLLRRYFDGSLSEPEVRRFQELLDRVPDYAHEFRQLLEVRSVLHDDALRLSPPPALAEPLHAVLERRFAALAPQADAAVPPVAVGAAAVPVRQVRRRSFVRGVMGTLTAFMLAIGVALTPEIRMQFPLAATGVSPAVQGEGMETANTNPAIASIERSVRNARRGASARSAVVRQVSNGVNANSTHAPVVPETPIEDPRLVNGIADRMPTETPADAEESLTLPRLGGRLLSSDFAPNSQNLSTAFGGNVNLNLPTPPPATTGEERPRTFNFGVVVASGQVAESPKPTAFMQNAYYLAFGLSPHDRLGVEAGFSNFRFDTRTAAPVTPTTSAKQADPKGLARRTAGGDFASNDGSNERSQAPISGAHIVELVTQRVEQTVNYGAVFYDRRVRLNKTWDVCGRVTVGAADQSLVGNVRAYVAYTPSKGGSFTITAGVGASGLYNMIARDRTVSGNVGLTYGIETGF